MQPKGTTIATPFLRVASQLMRHGFLGAEAFKEAAGWPNVERAAVAAGTTASGSWSGSLVSSDGIVDAFLEVLRPATIIGRMAELRRVPLRTSRVVQTTAVRAEWVAENAPKPLSAGAFQRIEAFPVRKVAAIVVATKELLKFTRPEDIEAFQRDMVAAVAERIDVGFIDPSLGATAALPGSVTHADSGAVSIQSSGATFSAIIEDLRAAVAVLIAANSTLRAAYWIMSARSATYLSSLRGTDGAVIFPGMTALGGTLLGLRVLTTTGIIVPTGSPSEVIIALLDGDRILIADDGEVRLERAEHATVQMSDTPVAGQTNQRSLFQENEAGLLVERVCNFRALPGAVAYISGVSY